MKVKAIDQVRLSELAIGELFQVVNPDETLQGTFMKIDPAPTMLGCSVVALSAPIKGTLQFFDPDDTVTKVEEVFCFHCTMHGLMGGEPEGVSEV